MPAMEDWLLTFGKMTKKINRRKFWFLEPGKRHIYRMRR